MQRIQHHYIDGAFVESRGTQVADLFNPATEERIGTVRLGDVTDARAAVAAARRAFPAMARTSKAQRIAMLMRLHDAVATHAGALATAMTSEYGAPSYFTGFSLQHAADVFKEMATTLETYPLTRRIGNAEVTMEPLGVVAAITPWNANISFICSKLAAAIASGSTIVIKPSEMSAIQTEAIAEVLHTAALPKGVFNIVNGDGQVVGADLSRHPDVAKITFTGSTATGRAILVNAAESFKRTTLELGGKGPQIILDDTDLEAAIPIVAMSGFMNSGQACVAGTRILVPHSRLEEVTRRLKAFVAGMKVGDAKDAEVRIGPMVSRKQWERVQSYIRLGVDEGAEVLVGGEGRPEGLSRGWFVRPTVFVGVRNDMRIAREEIFGPVLCVIPYRDEAEAIAIANDTPYGLQSYVLSSDLERAKRVAAQVQTGRVVINGAPHEPLAPFGGFKQSGIGREFGAFGLEAFLEPKAVLAAA